MGWVSRTAFVAVAGLSVVCACKAVFATNSAPERFIFFSGVDLWRYGAFAHGGLVWSPRGLDQEGFTFKALLSGGAYNYISGALGNIQVNGREFVAQLMPGWRFKFGSTEVRVFAGLDAQDHKLTPDDPGSGLRGQDLGLRVSADFWCEPSADTMLAADGSISTIDHQYSVRGAFGFRLLDRFYLGPEAQRFNSGGYQQTRLGVHVTALKTSFGEWSFAGGWGTDSSNRDGAYIRVGVLTRR